MSGLSSLSAEGVKSGAAALSRPAEEYINSPSIELQWAEAAFDYSQVHFDLIRSVDPKLLSLLPEAEEIYQSFRELFPDLKVLNKILVFCCGQTSELAQICRSKWSKLIRRASTLSEP